MSAGGVILVGRQRNSSQNTNDRNNDHQFNQGETLLHLSFHVNLLEVFKALSLAEVKQLACQVAPR